MEGWQEITVALVPDLSVDILVWSDYVYTLMIYRIASSNTRGSLYSCLLYS